MSKSSNVSALIAAMDADALVTAKIKNRSDLLTKLMAYKAAISSDPKVDSAIITKVKYLWKPVSATDLFSVGPDYGYPSSYEDLVKMVTNKRCPKAKNQTAEGYLEYLTNGEFSISTKDWEYYAGICDTEDGSKIKDGSIFFYAQRNQSEKRAPVEIWRYTAIKSRELITLFLKDKFIKEDFLKAKFDAWNTLVNRLHVYCGLDEYTDDYARVSTVAAKLRSVIPNMNNYRAKYSEILSLMDPYMITSETEIQVQDWQGDLVPFIGPEDRNPALCLLASVLASWNISIKDLIDIENEFIKVHGDLKPETLAKKRYAWHDLITRKLMGVTSGTVNAISNATDFNETDWNSVEENELDDQIIDHFDRVLAIRNNRFGGKKFATGKTDKFNRVRTGLLGPKKPYLGQKSRINNPCRNCARDYPNQPPHAYANCPRANHAKISLKNSKRINAVGEENELDEQAEAIRRQMDGDYQA